MWNSTTAPAGGGYGGATNSHRLPDDDECIGESLLLPPDLPALRATWPLGLLPLHACNGASRLRLARLPHDPMNR